MVRDPSDEAVAHPALLAILREPATTSHKAAVLLVERALVAEGLLSPKWIDGSFGTQTVEAYAAWQRALGYSGKDADGTPGLESLRELVKLHDFTVIND